MFQLLQQANNLDQILYHKSQNKNNKPSKQYEDNLIIERPHFSAVYLLLIDVVIQYLSLGLTLDLYHNNELKMVF